MRGRGGRADVVGGEKEKVIWLGDFNRHHPMWDEERHAHLFTRAALEVAQLLGDRLCWVYDPPVQSYSELSIT